MNEVVATPELVHHILQFLSEDDLLQCFLVSKKWNALAGWILWKRCNNRVAPRVAHGATRSSVSILFDAGHHAENRFSIGGLGDLRWILSAQPSHRCQISRINIFERPPKTT